ncbi:MAG: flagellar hook-basal body complex protein FliE [Anaerolineae bacterium]|nr:flagellar hook-basal body complex protein FliE [Anaerolineae bacterium]
MAINPVTQVGINPQLTLGGGVDRANRSGETSVGGASFADLARDALEQLNQLQQEADNAAVSLVAGEPVDVHDVMIALQKADLGFQIAIQVRNKLIEAYQEIMRMQV